MVVEGSVGEDTVNKNNKLLFKWLGIENLQGSHSDSYCFSVSVVYQIVKLKVLILMH